MDGGDAHPQLRRILRRLRNSNGRDMKEDTHSAEGIDSLAASASRPNFVPLLSCACLGRAVLFRGNVSARDEGGSEGEGAGRTWRRRGGGSGRWGRVFFAGLVAVAAVVQPAAAFVPSVGTMSQGGVGWRVNKVHSNVWHAPRIGLGIMERGGAGCGAAAAVMLAKSGRARKKPGTVAENKQAKFNYQIDEKFECGIALVGTEVKSCRAGHIQIGVSLCVFGCV